MKIALSIIIPVYHEEKNILKVISSITKYVHTPHEIILVYDNQEDPTVPVVKQYLQTNKKKGIYLQQNIVGNKEGVMNAIKTGFHVANGEAVVVIMADLADDIRQVDTMYALIQQQSVDIVCASRFMKGGKKIGGPFIKNLLSRTACLTLYYLFRIPTHDATNAFKMYRSSLFTNITIESKGGFEYSLEIILKAHKKGYTIAEIPTVWKDREEGKSNFKLLSWLPYYLQWYLTAIPVVRNVYKYTAAFWLLLFIGIAALLCLLQIGASLQQGILLRSSLDFSWVSDAIERYLHGYVAGRDYLFTYGPMFQLLYALPAIIFHIPSYTAAAISPVIIEIVFLFVLLSLVCLLTTENKERILLFGYLLFIVGVINPDYANIMLRSSLPLLFAVLAITQFFSDRGIIRLLVIAALPSLFGLYSYDIFLQCVFITFVFAVYAVGSDLLALFTAKQFHSGKLIKSTSLRKGALLFLFLMLFQGVISIILSGGMSYSFYSLATISDYFYVMNTAWEFGKSNYLFIFPILLPVLWLLLIRNNTYAAREKKIFIALLVASLLALRAAFVRSDSGHIEMSILPSIIGTFIFLFFLRKQMNRRLFTIALIFFALIPFRENYFAFIAGSNIKEIVHVIKNKPDFLAIYKLPSNYYYSTEDLQRFSRIINSYKGKVFVYPYDSYLLNINHTTYNSFPLQFYDYSNVPIEKKAISEMQKNPPIIIILGIDTKGAIQLDNMPNFTRNPLFAQYVLSHYSVDEVHTNYLILHYHGEMHRQSIVNTNECSVEKMHIHTNQLAVIQTDVINLIKPSVFFINSTQSRIPFKPSITDYYYFRNITDARAVSKLFLHTIANNQGSYLVQSILLEENPFTKKIKKIDPQIISYQTYCVL